MTKRLSLTAVVRKQLGRKIKAIRRQGLIPGNVFGKKTTSVPVQFQSKAFLTLYEIVAETSLFDLQIDGEPKSRPVLITGVQRHPVSNAVLHVDFHQVSLTEKVTAKIPVEIIGESPAVKDEGAVMLVTLSEIEIEALPTELPENIKVDITSLVKIGDSLLVKDLTVDSALTVLSGPDETIVTLQAPKEEEVVETPTEAVAGVEPPVEAETTVQGKPEPTPEEPQKS